MEKTVDIAGRKREMRRILEGEKLRRSESDGEGRIKLKKRVFLLFNRAKIERTRFLVLEREEEDRTTTTVYIQLKVTKMPFHFSLILHGVGTRLESRV